MAVRVIVTLALAFGILWDPGAAWLILILNVFGAIGGLSAGALAELFSPAAAVARLAAAGLILTALIIVFSADLRRSRISPAM